MQTINKLIKEVSIMLNRRYTIRCKECGSMFNAYSYEDALDMIKYTGNGFRFKCQNCGCEKRTQSFKELCKVEEA
jgi:hypothetical protein